MIMKLHHEHSMTWRTNENQQQFSMIMQLEHDHSCMQLQHDQVLLKYVMGLYVRHVGASNRELMQTVCW